MKKVVKPVEEFEFAYGRVSTVHQKLDSQLDEFKKLGIPDETVILVPAGAGACTAVPPSSSAQISQIVLPSGFSYPHCLQMIPAIFLYSLYITFDSFLFSSFLALLIF